MAGDDFRPDENCFGLVLWRSIGMDRDAVPDGEFETVSVDRCQPVPFRIIDDDLIVGPPTKNRSVIQFFRGHGQYLGLKQPCSILVRVRLNLSVHKKKADQSFALFIGSNRTLNTHIGLVRVWRDWRYASIFQQ